jgi:hypothetical protein
MYTYSIRDDMYIGESTDPKPTEVDAHTKLLEWDTKKMFIFEKGAWRPM